MALMWLYSGLLRSGAAADSGLYLKPLVRSRLKNSGVVADMKPQLVGLNSH
jgi:hypothetical protein